MALILTTTAGVVIEIEHPSHSQAEVVMVLKEPDAKIKLTGSVDEIVFGKKLRIGLTVSEIEELVFMLRE